MRFSWSHIALNICPIHVSDPFLQCDIAIASDAISSLQAFVTAYLYFHTFLHITANNMFYRIFQFFRKHIFLPQNHVFITNHIFIAISHFHKSQSHMKRHMSPSPAPTRYNDRPVHHPINPPIQCLILYCKPSSLLCIIAYPHITLLTALYKSFPLSTLDANTRCDFAIAHRKLPPISLSLITASPIPYIHDPLPPPHAILWSILRH